MRTRNVSEVKKDMLSLVHILAKRLPKMLCVIYRVTLHKRTDAPNVADFVWLETQRLRQRIKVIWCSVIFKTASGLRGTEKKRRICVLDDRRSDDNMSTLALSTLIWHNYTTLNHCQWKLLICITHSGKMELLIGEQADKHSTLNVFDFLKQRKKTLPCLIWDTYWYTYWRCIHLICKKSLLTYSLTVFVRVLSQVWPIFFQTPCFYSF